MYEENFGMQIGDYIGRGRIGQWDVSWWQFWRIVAPYYEFARVYDRWRRSPINDGTYKYYDTVC